MDEAATRNRAWADAMLRRRTEELARKPDEAAGVAAGGAAAPSVALLVGHGADGRYGVELRHLARIVPLPRVARVPGEAPELLGLIAVDGRVMRLFDVDRLCGRTVVPAGGGFAAVLRGGRRPVALRLRAVETVADREPGRFAPLPEAGPYVAAVTDDRIAVLNVEAILDRLGSTGEP